MPYVCLDGKKMNKEKKKAPIVQIKPHMPYVCLDGKKMNKEKKRL